MHRTRTRDASISLFLWFYSVSIQFSQQLIISEIDIVAFRFIFCMSLFIILSTVVKVDNFSFDYNPKVQNGVFPPRELFDPWPQDS